MDKEKRGPGMGDGAENEGLESVGRKKSSASNSNNNDSNVCNSSSFSNHGSDGFAPASSVAAADGDGVDNSKSSCHTTLPSGITSFSSAAAAFSSDACHGEGVSREDPAESRAVTSESSSNQIDSDLALARTLQEQERAFMLLYEAQAAAASRSPFLARHGGSHSFLSSRRGHHGLLRDLEAMGFSEDDDGEWEEVEEGEVGNEEEEGDDGGEEEEEDDGSEGGQGSGGRGRELGWRTDRLSVGGEVGRRGRRLVGEGSSGEVGDGREVEEGREGFESDEAYARYLQELEEREMEMRLMALGRMRARLGREDEGIEEGPPSHHDIMAEEEWDEEDELDPDDLTYEQLTALGEVIGTESKGLSAEKLSVLPKSKFSMKKHAPPEDQASAGEEQCTICRLEFEEAEEVVDLPCSHQYHEECIKQWLSLNKVCPICTKEVVIK